ncbi:hypothetical protein, partial [Thermogutta sp.]|uniref:hypothetical protein n=1 Tax=Thermogutta sp. TaxID=1962930 RepID=UPI003C7C85D4
LKWFDKPSQYGSHGYDDRTRLATYGRSRGHNERGSRVDPLSVLAHFDHFCWAESFPVGFYELVPSGLDSEQARSSAVLSVRFPENFSDARMKSSATHRCPTQAFFR